METLKDVTGFIAGLALVCLFAFGLYSSATKTAPHGLTVTLDSEVLSVVVDAECWDPAQSTVLVLRSDIELVLVGSDKNESRLASHSVYRDPKPRVVVAFVKDGEVVKQVTAEPLLPTNKPE